VSLKHYFRTTFCLSEARRNFLLQQGRSLTMNVFADNGADVYLNGQLILKDSNANHDAKYWNNQLTVPSNALVVGKAPLNAR
jgi:hypothetical protein